MDSNPKKIEKHPPPILPFPPLSLAFGNMNLMYQRGISKSSAIQIGANYWYRFLGVEVSGFGVRGGYQFFVTNKTKYSPEGFYVGPNLSYNSLTEKSTDSKATTVGVGLLLGYQWIWKSGISLDLGIGPMYVFANEEGTENSFEGFLPNVIIALGYNF